MILIGITGGIGHGKSTLAEIFARLEPASLHLESSDIIAEVANALQARTGAPPNPHNIAEVLAWLQPLPEIVTQVTHTTITPPTFSTNDIAANPAFFDKLFVYLQQLQKEPQLLTAQITPANKTQFRAILQWLGGYLVSTASPGIWYEEIGRRADAAAAQGTRLCTVGGVRYPSDADIIRRHNGVVVLIRRPLITEQDLSDPTERERTKIIPDTTLVNDASIRALGGAAQQMLIDIQTGKLRHIYEAMAG